MKYWVLPGRLEARLKAAPDPMRKADLAHEPVILIWPEERLGEVVWDPDMAPPGKESTTKERRAPMGLAPP